jgi:ParB/RepB/Spo0J family partition protein
VSAPASLALSRLRVWPGNPRKTVPDLTTLTESVRKVGVLAPLLVRELAEAIEEGHESNGPEGWVIDKLITHEVIAGQCRYLAATAAGLAEVPVTVREVDDATALELGLVENAQRNAPAPMEEAEALDALVRTHGRSVDDVAARLGHPVTWVRRRLALLSLCREARTWLTSGKLPLAHALQLAAVDEATQLRVVERFRHVEALPSSKLFGSDVATYLRTLASAPFDAAGCAGCSTRTDVQADLFGSTPDNARCLGPACWDAKVAEVWTAAQKVAKRRKLPVIADPIEHDWRGLARLPDGRLLTAASPSEDARPVAVARDRHGRVLDLYEPPPAPADGDADEEDEDEVPDAREAERAAKAAAAQERKAAADAARLATVTRLTEALASPAGLVAGLRLALLTVARDLDGTRDLRVVLEARGMSPAVFRDAELAAEVPERDLALVLAATLCAAWATDPDADDAEPLERALRALLVAPAVARAPAPVVATAPAASGDAVRVWVPEAAWDALSQDDRDDLTEPFGGVVIEWQGTDGYVFADVPAEALSTMRGMLEALGAGAVEGAERPTVTMLVRRGDWLQHRSGLRDTAKAPLHKQWLPKGESRAATVQRGDEVIGKVLAYCQEHKVPLFVNGKQVTGAEATAPTKKGAK